MKNIYFTFKSYLKNIHQEESGMSALGWAFAMPVFAVLLGGGFETGRYILIQQKIDKAAFVVGDTVSRGRIAEKDYAKVTFELAGRVLEPLANMKAAAVTLSAFQKEGGQLVKKWQTGPATNVSGADIQKNITLENHEAVLVSTVKYEYKPFLFKSLFKEQTFEKAYYFRPRKDEIVLDPITAPIAVESGPYISDSGYDKLKSGYYTPGAPAGGYNTYTNETAGGLENGQDMSNDRGLYNDGYNNRGRRDGQDDYASDKYGSEKGGQNAEYFYDTDSREQVNARNRNRRDPDKNHRDKIRETRKDNAKNNDEGNAGNRDRNNDRDKNRDNSNNNNKNNKNDNKNKDSGGNNKNNSSSGGKSSGGRPPS